MTLLQVWPILTTLLIIFLAWMAFRFGRKMYRNMQWRINTAKRQLEKEFQVMEAERSRIAKDLHDDLGPLLSAVSMRMNCLHPTGNADQEHLNTMRQYLSEVIERLGNIAFNLTPLVVEQKGLHPALQEFFACYQDVTDADLEYVYEIKTSLPANNALQLYRIIQEIVHNGIKHSKASRIQVYLLEKEKNLSMLYADNGIGFEYQKALESGGRGLGNVKSRIEMLGGKMTLNTRVGRGVEYSFQMPL